MEHRMREIARDLLESGQVNLVIGYGRGTGILRTTPVFIRKPSDAGQLVYNPLCGNNLVKYLLDQRNKEGRAAVCVKGCDSRAVNRLIQDRQIDREKVYIIGLPCGGILDPDRVEGAVDPGEEIKETVISGEGYDLITAAGKYSFTMAGAGSEKCSTCQNHNPVVYDVMAGDPSDTPDIKDDGFDDVRKIEEMTVEQKSAYWDRQFSRCLRCYACRNSCTACSCRECVFDQVNTGWVSRSSNLSENTAFHLIRAFHVAGRCVDCGECERVCPVGIPLRVLNRKILMDLKDLFNTATPGLTPDGERVLGQFSADDPEEFM
ncbi:MAG: dehydrogenase [Peptococcaceae bacterium BRH_c4a]|nr:MAG: dehydrogenase [Peptococcaceae bacterium BRH_c4a]